MTKLFGSKAFDYYRRVLVVAANEETILKTDKAPSSIKYKILRADNLVRQIEYDLSHRSKDDYVDNKTRMIDKTNMEYPFQLDQVCINGSRFFDMVRYYGSLFKQITKSDTYKPFGTHERSAYKIISFLNTYNNRNRKGDTYTRELFNCMLLYYIDRFGFEEIDKVVWKLFKEVYKLRLMHYSVKLATIDNYAIDGRMFTTIRDAQTPFDIINIPTCQLENIAANIDENKDELLKLYKQ